MYTFFYISTIWGSNIIFWNNLYMWTGIYIVFVSICIFADGTYTVFVISVTFTFSFVTNISFTHSFGGSFSYIKWWIYCGIGTTYENLWFYGFMTSHVTTFTTWSLKPYLVLTNIVSALSTTTISWFLKRTGLSIDTAYGFFK